MADASHLERMGRELKCPICLGLLDYAASLSCNHVFCNSCIQKSMKSGSNCPVCKVPYQRREIRPALHMDNLVKIYKNMEVASGLNLFVSQNPVTTKSSGPEEQTGGGDAGVQGSGLVNSKTVKHQRKEGRLTNSLSKSKRKNSGRNGGKPSFLTNKRVQVPQPPITVTPRQQAKNEIGKTKMINELMDNSSSSPCGQLPDGSTLSPFFWLREDEDVEKSSQQIEMDHLTSTPAKVPSFSDIKDSDDDVSMSSKEGTLRRCNNADLSDSEMFEWTQRACSPELCSSPVKVQLGAVDEFDRRLEKFEEPLKSGVPNKKVITEHLQYVSSLEESSIRVIDPHNNSSPGSRSGDDQNGKRGRKESNRSHTKCRKKNMVQVREGPDNWETNEFLQGQGCGSELALVNSSQARCVRSSDLALPNEVNDLFSWLPGSSDCKRGFNEDKLKKRKSMRQSNRVVTKKQNLVTSGIIDEAIVSHDIRHEDVASKSYISMGISVKQSSCHEEGTTGCRSNRNKKRYRQQIRCGIKDKTSEGDFCREAVENGDVHLEVVAPAEGDNDKKVTGSHHQKVTLAEGDVYPQRDTPILNKCDVNSTKCAFCQSTEETEASGEMVHYSQGRPVSESNSAGSVIHSHRNCTEWAPNVYFDNDVAVNLEEELARSRRIKCSLCGMKGAALGCYEKSCRKSFHVPCAKALWDCCWDSEHFVILCPLHASLKLPCELSTSPPKKEKSNQKGNNLNQETQPAGTRDTKRNLRNFRRSSEKVVLCCSGLSTVEKETVSEFAKTSGAVISTTWNLAVTHVIASVNENEACRRTLKVLMGILEGKWILSIKWVEACVKATELVDEAPFEISSDIHGVRNGPLLGRLRLLNKQPKLFAGFKFYLSGDFAPSYKGYLQDLVIAAGGTILHRKPIAESDGRAASVPRTIIFYSVELPETCDLRKKDMILARRCSDAEALASSTRSKVANNVWVLNCIAGHKLQDL